MDTTESALDSITDYRPPRAGPAAAGLDGHRRRRLAQGARRRDRPDHPGHQGDGERHLRRQVHHVAARRPRRAPYKLGADDTYQGNQAGLDPAIAGIVREIGPGVTMTINTVARELLGDGRTARPTASCSTRCATSPTTCKANDGAALRGGDMTGAQTPARHAARRPRPQRRADEPPRGRRRAPGPDHGRADEPALEHRGRRHRQDDDRVQLAERRLPGRAARRREHRAVVANGFPPLSR